MASFKIKMPRFEPCAGLAALLLSISIPAHSLSGDGLLESAEVAPSLSASLPRMVLQSAAVKLTKRMEEEKDMSSDDSDDPVIRIKQNYPSAGWKILPRNGKGKVKFEDAEYEGEWKGGVPHGQGKLTYDDGDVYEGPWTNGEPEAGKGTWTLSVPDGDGDKYEGPLNSEDEYHGEGTYTWASGLKYIGNWMKGKKHGYGKRTYGDGSIFYEGYWVNDNYHGQGKLIDPDGDEFEGLWKNGTRCDGYGKMMFEGHKYEGHLENGVPHGSGKWTYANRNVYEGQLENGVPHGMGTKKYADGRVYVGQWKKRKEDGHGKMTYSDRSVYEGKWENGKKHGCGVMTYLDGVTETQWWKHGKLQFSSEEEQKGHVDSHNWSEKGDSLMPEQGSNQGKELEEDKLPAIEKKEQLSKFTKLFQHVPLSKEKDDKSDLEEEKDGSASPPEQDVDQVEDHSSRSSGQDEYDGQRENGDKSQETEREFSSRVERKNEFSADKSNKSPQVAASQEIVTANVEEEKKDSASEDDLFKKEQNSGKGQENSSQGSEVEQDDDKSSEAEEKASPEKEKEDAGPSENDVLSKSDRHQEDSQEDSVSVKEIPKISEEVKQENNTRNAEEEQNDVDLSLVNDSSRKTKTVVPSGFSRLMNSRLCWAISVVVLLLLILYFF